MNTTRQTRTNVVVVASLSLSSFVCFFAVFGMFVSLSALFRQRQIQREREYNNRDYALSHSHAPYFSLNYLCGMIFKKYLAQQKNLYLD